MEGTSTTQVAELNGTDGKIELHIIEPISGEVKHRCAISQSYEGPAPMLVAADINSDGRDEVIFNYGKELVCMGLGTIGLEEMWRFPFEQIIGPPVVADVDGDGYVEILLTDYMGNLICVGAQGAAE